MNPEEKAQEETYTVQKSSREIKREFKTWFFKQHTEKLTNAIVESDETLIKTKKLARKLARRQIRNRLWTEHRTSKKENR